MLVVQSSLVLCFIMRFIIIIVIRYTGNQIKMATV